MATLVSPGVSVTVTDESFYASAGEGTIPLVVLATAANKYQAGSTTALASGTLSTNANKLYLMTSQRDVLQTFGAPKFYSVGGSQQYDNELNEVGLFSLYQYLGIANSAYVLRADLDLNQLQPSPTEPVGSADNGDYWLDLNQSTWGIFRSNGNVNSAYAWTAQTPTVISNKSALEIVVQGRTATKIISGSASVISTNGTLVINGVSISLLSGDSISTVASKINNTTNVVQKGISATVFSKVEKYALNASAYGDVFNLRLVCNDIDTPITLTGSSASILTDLGLVSEPANVIAPRGDFGASGDYVIDAISIEEGDTAPKNKIWEKITITSNSITKAWWFKVGSVDSNYPGWGWREAEPRVVTGSTYNQTFTPGNTFQITVGALGPYTVTVPAAIAPATTATLTQLVGAINDVLNSNNVNAVASRYTVGNANYLRITNYDSTDMWFNDVSTQAGTPAVWRTAGILPTQVYFGDVTGTVSNPTFVAATLLTSSAAADDPGLGYAVGDVLTVSGGVHSVSTQLSVSTIQVVSAVAANGGALYSVNDTITFSGSGYVTPTILRVTSESGGQITGLEVIQAGQFNAATPSNPISATVTDGAGYGATINLFWGVGVVSVPTPGVYTTYPTNPASVTGGSGSGATFTLTPGFETSNTFTIDVGSGPVTVHVPAAPNNSLDGVIAAINSAFLTGPIVASKVTSGSNNYLKIVNQNNTSFTLEDVSGTPLNSAGIKVGYVFGRKMLYQGYSPSLTVPGSLADIAPTNVWINTTSADRGANLVVKRFINGSWVRMNVTPNTGFVPMYSSDSVANAGFGANKQNGSIYARYNNDGTDPAEADIMLYKWDGENGAWMELNYTASLLEPSGPPAAGTLWYSTALRYDIMVGNGQIWKGYRNVYPATDPSGPILSSTEPLNQSDGTALVDNDIWIDTSVTDDFVAYRYDSTNTTWRLIDNTDHSSPSGIIFADARPNDDGTEMGSDTPEAMAVSDYVDPDAPDALLYPASILLMNTRYSTNNVKQWVPNKFPAMAWPDRWVTASGNGPDGTPWSGYKSQRQMVVRALQSVLVSNQDARAESTYFNLLATPGYPECIDEMVTLNVDKKETAFIVGDTPARLAPDGTSISNWASNANNAASNGDDGLITASPYVGVYYPWALSTNLDGTEIFVPPSMMALRTIAYNDQVAYPWFAPAGFNRGLVSGVTSVGYLLGDGTYQPLTLNQGQRDVMYINKINPIAFIPNRGLVVYGQKTLNSVASALDRINVARLINYLKYQLDNLAKPFLFEPNDKQTRQAVTTTFNSFMGNLVGLRALYDFAVVCDETNNTPARIDRNELWIDIAIKPEKAIEFIYIPIRILNTGDPLPNGSQNATA